MNRKQAAKKRWRAVRKSKAEEIRMRRKYMITFTYERSFKITPAA